MTTPDRIRVLLVDDHAEFRGGLRGLLAREEDIEVVGEAANGEEALRLTERTAPDVVLMDLHMPGVNGIEATRQLIAARPFVGVLVVTMFEDDESVFAAIRAGARGYLLKGARKAETLRAIRAVAGGEAIFSPAIARRLADYFATPVRNAEPFPELTPREREILEMIAGGQTNDEIAATLFLSLKTVRNYVTSILDKLQVADRAQAALRGREAGLGGP
ncbi:MAG: response regulator transcription factor [Chloroflexi bacterium]|nr:response regulator transcription factor [Chloroflexota bacterium]MDA1145427.1 response regulator transcription factor [Chloroflexota bacterium]